MTVLKILAVLAIVVSVAWFLSWLQAFSLRKYQHTLFDLGAFSLLVIGWILFYLAIYVLPEGAFLSDVFAEIRNLSFPEPLSNSIVLVVLASIIFVGVFLLLAFTTNPIFALIAWTFQLIGAALIVPFLIFLIPGGKKKKKKRMRTKRRR